MKTRLFFSKFNHFYPMIICLGFFIVLLISVVHGITRTSLEDDMLWLVPSVSYIVHNHSLGDAWGLFHAGELNLVDGAYFSTLISAFGFQFPVYTIISVCFHFLNTLVFYGLLVAGIRLSRSLALTASLIYLTFFGHFHAYLWPLSMHHQFVLFFMFSILLYYFKANDLIEGNSRFKDYRGYYFIVIGLSFLAGWQKLSVMIIPFVILIHIFFAAVDRRKLIFKYSLWSPALFLLSAYQIVLLFTGGHGYLLTKSLEDFYDVVGRHPRSLATVCLILGTQIGIQIFIGFLLLGVFRIKKHNFFIPWVKRISLLTIFVPQLLFLSLVIFFRPLSFEKSLDIYDRWHSFVLPDHPWTAAMGLLGALLLLSYFLYFTFKKNRRLIVFIFAYVFAVLYQGNLEEGIPSRYLIYTVPFFSLAFALFCMEAVPSWIGRLKRPLIGRIYRRALVIALSVIFLFNVLAVKLVTHRIWLNSYLGIYDYVKIAHLIRKDLERQKVPRNFQSICVSGVPEIQYNGFWQIFHQGDETYRRFGPFPIILLSALGKREGQIDIHLQAESCSKADIRHAFNGRTVINAQGDSPELFVEYFDAAMQALKHKQYKEAEGLLERAVEERPFLIQMTAGRGVLDRALEHLILREITQSLHQINNVYYSSDKKIKYADALIRREKRDYALALAALAYLYARKEESGKADRLLSKAHVFVPPEEIAVYSDRILPETEKDAFKNFLLKNSKGEHGYNRDVPVRLIEKYRGFRIFWLVNYYYALPAQARDFDLEKFKTGDCSTCFIANKQWEIREKIDAVPGVAPQRPKIVSPEYEWTENKEIVLRYRLKMMGLPLGIMEFETKEDSYGEKPALRAEMTLIPPLFLRWISMGNLGVQLVSYIDEQRLLPRHFLFLDSYSKKKGKKGRAIEYNHDQLWMIYKGRREDMQADTRDYASLILWLMRQDYEHNAVIQSSFNIDRKNFLVIGRVKGAKLKLQFLHVGPDQQTEDVASMTIDLKSAGDQWIPLNFKIHRGLINITGNLDE